MEYMGNKAYWDDKFGGRSDSPLSPEKTLVENIDCFKLGSVLDIACGDGRNALFLLERGFQVTGVDFSEKALERLKTFARRNNYEVKTVQADLNAPDALEEIGLFDNVLINHYRLSGAVLTKISSHISKQGILFVCGFGHHHKPDSTIREEELIQPGDFDGIRNAFKLIESYECEDTRGSFVTYIFRKR